jgi:uncharacterized protein YjbI with pentapeptide repeats
MGSLEDAAPGILQGVGVVEGLVYFVVILLVLLVGYTIGSQVTGFGTHVVKETETFEYQNGVDNPPVKTSTAYEKQLRRTLWDWMTVLLISVAIAGVGLWYTSRQAEQQQAIQNKQEKDAALQAYLDHMGQLMLNKDRPLGESKQDDAVQTLARMRTVTALRMLDAEQNESVTTFLKESDLVNFRLPSDKTETVLRLDHADLKEAALEDSNVGGFDLRYTNLRGANLRNANLDVAQLTFADLGGADLRDATMHDTDLQFANLNGADLNGADLSGADLSGADLENAKNLNVEQINKAAAVDSATKLPADLRERSRWNNTSATVGQPVTYPTLGARLVARKDLKSGLVETIGIPKEVPSSAVLIYDVQADSPAQEAGIQSGDIITTVNGHQVQGPDDLRAKVDKAGRHIWFNAWRSYFQGWDEGTLDIHWLENE